MKTRVTLAAALCAVGIGLAATPVAAQPAASARGGNGESALNQTSYWENYLEGQGYENVTCVKYDDLEGTTFVAPAAPDGEDWLLAIVKAGSRDSTATPNEENWNVAPGTVLTHGSGKDISHVILCDGPSPRPRP